MPTYFTQAEELLSRRHIELMSWDEYTQARVDLENQQGPAEPMECPHCGTLNSVGLEIREHRFCDEECAIAYGYARCDRCGGLAPADDCITVGSECFCCSECAYEAGYEQCEECGRWHEAESGIVAYDTRWSDPHFFCDASCAHDADYYLCDHCDEWREGRYHVQVGGNTHRWCERCADEDSRCCESCGERHCIDDMVCTDYGDWYCRDCGCGTEYLHEYGWTPSIRFFGHGPLFLGVELETDGGHNVGRYCEELMGIEGFPDRFWMTEDSSLIDGVEITSMPMTLAEHVKFMDGYEAIGDTARRFNFKSHDGGRCGLHIHVSRNALGKSEAVQDAGGYKMMRLLQRFEYQFHIFSRRNDKQWCGYKTSRDYSPKNEQPSILKATCDKEGGPLEKARAMKHERSHSQCLNFQHSSTYEFRIFRGTLKWETFYACLALVEGMVHTVKRHGSTWVETVNWYDLIDEVVSRVTETYPRECLANYLEEKGLR